MKISDIRTHIIGEYGIANSNRYQISFVPGRDLSEWLDYAPMQTPMHMIGNGILTVRMHKYSVG